VTLGGGMSRYLTDTNEHRINFMGGLVRSTEDATDSVESTDSVEAMTGLVIECFRYDAPELDVSSQLLVFERISDESRTRGNLDLSFRWELIQDFTWGMSVYYSFDSAPENADASGNDCGVVTTLGWSFQRCSAVRPGSIERQYPVRSAWRKPFLLYSRGSLVPTPRSGGVLCSHREVTSCDRLRSL